MSNMTPFEIRLELLKMAKEMLSDDYYGKRQKSKAKPRLHTQASHSILLNRTLSLRLKPLMASFRILL